MKSHSIRRALLVRGGIGVGVLLSLLSAGIYLTVRHGLYKELDASIEQTAALLSNQVEMENDEIIFEWQEGLGTNRALINLGLFQYWDDTTGKTTRSPGLGSRDLPKFHGADETPLIKDIMLPGGHRHARAIGVRIHPFVLPEEMQRMKESGRVIDPKTRPFTLVVAGDAKPVHHVLARLGRILSIGTLLTLGLGYVLIRRAVSVSLRPIDELSHQVQERSEHQLDSALDLPGALPHELKGLARNFDSLLARVAALRQRERDFIRHAAHELRTPIAGLRATTDLALSQPRDAATYAAHLETCRKSAVELGELVKRLTALSRIGQSTGAAVIESLPIESIMEDCLRTFRPAFDRRGINVSLTAASPPLNAMGDAALTRIILNNLLDNAASYAPSGGEVLIRFRHAGDRVEVSVSNPVEDLHEDPERLFEPLFRRESSRHDADSHLGIGLTLSQDAARAMGATLQAHKTEDGWIEFILTMPAGTAHV